MVFTPAVFKFLAALRSVAPVVVTSSIKITGRLMRDFSETTEKISLAFSSRSFLFFVWL